MKKQFLFVVLFVASIMSMTAQTSLLATLSHDGEVTTFFGNTALQDAYKSAQDGDIITLSPGSFSATSISKNITLRGGGMVGDNQTIISGSFNVEPSSGEGAATLEGLFINGYLNVTKTTNTTLLKCFISGYLSTSLDSNNFKAIHCDIDGASSSLKGIFTACHFKNASFNKATIENCILERNHANSMFYGTFVKNSIISTASTNTSYIFDSGNTIQGCVYIGSATDPFQRIPASDSNKVKSLGTKFLKDGSATYELLDELQTEWIGTDGTQIGMHGGSLPFDTETTNLKIKKFNVSSKTSADGKLSVDIVIDAD